MRIRFTQDVGGVTADGVRYYYEAEEAYEVPDLEATAYLRSGAAVPEIEAKPLELASVAKPTETGTAKSNRKPRGR